MCKIHHNYFKKEVVVEVVVLYVIYNISMVKYIEAMTMISIIYAKWLWLVKISGCGGVFGVKIVLEIVHEEDFCNHCFFLVGGNGT